MVRYLALVVQIALVPYQNLAHALSGKLVDLGHPGLDVVEGVSVRHVVYDDYSVSASVIRGRKRSEPFLAGRVPLSNSTPNLRFAALLSSPPR